MAKQELRKHPRYDTDVKVHFHVPYEFRTEVDFSIAERQSSEKYIGFSKNISAYGLCFESNKEVRCGEHLWLELHLPKTSEIIYMQGTARWIQPSLVVPEAPKMYLIGVEIKVVDGVDVEQTIYYDRKYSVFWSELLERVMGSFAQFHKKFAPAIVLRGVLKNSEGRYLMLKRSAQSKTWPSKWEFPGGKVVLGEHTTAALKREFFEETSLQVKPLQRIMDFSYELADGTVEYKIFLVEKVSGEPAISPEHDEMRWLSLDEMSALDVSPPLIAVIHSLKG